MTREQGRAGVGRITESLRPDAGDPQVTALQVPGEGADDAFILCEEGAEAVSIGGVTFQGRALLLRRKPTLEVHGVRVQSAIVGQRPITPNVGPE